MSDKPFLCIMCLKPTDYKMFLCKACADKAEEEQDQREAAEVIAAEALDDR